MCLPVQCFVQLTYDTLLESSVCVFCFFIAVVFSNELPATHAH